jgi:hypothetical protein
MADRAHAYETGICAGWLTRVTRANWRERRGGRKHAMQMTMGREATAHEIKCDMTRRIGSMTDRTEPIRLIR